MHDPEVVRYLPYDPFTEEDARKFVKENIDGEARMFPVIFSGDGRLIGHMVFHVWDERFATWEIGWVFHREYHGWGFATEAADRLLEYGFEQMGLHRIIATCDPRNTASYRVMEKNGMRREGHSIKCIQKNGEWIDEYFYATLDEEWAAGKGTAFQPQV